MSSKLFSLSIMAGVVPYGFLYHTAAAYPLANRSSPFVVHQVMHSAVEWVERDVNCVAAAKTMQQRRIGALPVKDSRPGLLLGIVTDRDLVLRVLAVGLDPSTTPVSRVMTAPFVAMVYDDANLVEAEHLMLNRGVRRLLVMRRTDNVICGIISVDDIAMAGMARRAGEIVRGIAVFAKEQVEAGRHNDSCDRSDVTAVRDAMSHTVEWILDSETCRTAAFKMLTHKVGCLPVRAASGSEHLVGIITDRDLVVRLLAESKNADNTMIRDVMTPEVTCCYDDDSLADAQCLMLRHSVRRLIVLLRATNKVAGIVSVDDIAVRGSQERAGTILGQTSFGRASC